jgi:Tol biopolymer transport system component
VVAALAMVAVGLPAGAQAAGLDPADPGPCTIGWDGGARTSSWHDRANWTGDRVPGSTDVACVTSTASGPEIVYSAGSSTVGALRTDATLTVRGGELALVADSYTGAVDVQGGRLSPGWLLDTSHLDQSAGTVGGAGALRVVGAFNWSGGTQEGPGHTSVGTGAEREPGLLVTGTGVRTVSGRAMNLQGGLAWYGGGELAVASGTTLRVHGRSTFKAPAALTGGGTVLLDGTVDVAGVPVTVGGALDAVRGSAIGINGSAGALALVGGGRIDGDVVTSDGGTLRAEGGTVALGGSVTGSGVDVTGGLLHVRGTLDVDRTRVGGGRMVLAGTTSKAGALLVAEGGTVEVASRTVAASMSVTGGTVTGTGELAVAGDAEWIAGTLSGEGVLSVGGALTVEGGDLRLEDRVLLPGDLRADQPTQITTTGTAAIAVSRVLAVHASSLQLRGPARLAAEDTRITGGSNLLVEGPFDTSSSSATVRVEGASSLLDVRGGGTHEGRITVKEGLVALGGTTDLLGSSVVTAEGDVHTEIRDGAVVTYRGRAQLGALHVRGELVLDTPVAARATRVDNAGGDVVVASGAQLEVTEGAYVQTRNASTRLAGDLSLLAVQAGGLDLQGGVLQGTGVVAGAVRNASTIELSRLLTVRGPYTQTEQGALDVHVAWGALGRLAVEGPAALAGGLHTTEVGGAYLLGPHTFLEASSRTGEFADSQCDGVEYTATSARVRPSSCAGIAPAEVVEGFGPLQFTVTLTEKVARPVVVSYERTGGTAEPGVDVEGTTGTVTVPAGQLSARFEVPVVDDDAEEASETVVLQVTSNDVLLGLDTATGTIIDGDERADTAPLELVPHRVPTAFVASAAATNDKLVVGHEDEDADHGRGWAFRLSDEAFAHVPGMSSVIDINAHDLLVGHCDIGACTRKAGVSTALQVPALSAGYPNAVNDAGTVVGSWTDGSTRIPVDHAVRWAAPNAPLEVLPVPRDSAATAINSRGDITGTTVDMHGSRSWLLSASGSLTWLPSFPGADITSARAIDDAGRVYGAAARLGGGAHGRAWRWTPGSGFVDLGPGTVNGVNGRGDAVGSSDGRGVLWRAGKTRPLDLNAALPEGSPWRVQWARAIGEKGTIAATARTENSTGNVLALAPPEGGCAVCLEGVRAEQQAFPDPTSWVPVLTDVVEGNRVRVTARVTNHSEQERVVGVTFTGPSGPLGDATRPVRIGAGRTVEVREVLDTNGLAWRGQQAAPPHAVAVAVVDDDGLAVGEKAVQVSVAPRPAVLVHGMNSDASTWAAYPALLSAAHPRWRSFAVDTMNTKPWIPNRIAQNAELLATYVTKVQTQQNAWQVDLVGHSMGGLISRHYLQELMPVRDGRRAVQRLVQLGTPNAGSPCADLFSVPLTRELRTDLMAAFNERITDTRGVRVSVAVGVHLPFTCDVPVTGDDVVPVPSAQTGVSDAQLHEIAHTAMTADGPLFRAFVQPRLDGSRPATARAALRTSAALSTATEEQSGILALEAVRLLPGASEVVEVPVPAGTTRLSAGTAAPGVQVELERGRSLARSTVMADGAFLTSTSVESPAAGVWLARLVNTGEEVLDAPLTVWAKGLPGRVVAQAQQVGDTAAVRVTARVLGATPAGTSTMAAVVVDAQGRAGATGTLRDDGTGADRVAGDGTFEAVLPATGGSVVVEVSLRTNSTWLADSAATVVRVAHDTPGNDAPTAQPAAFTARLGTDLRLTVGGADADGDPLLVQVVAGPQHGTLGGNDEGDGSFVYRPAAGYLGADGFAFRVGDGLAWSRPAAVSLTVERAPTTVVWDGPVPAAAPAGSTLHAKVLVTGPRGEHVPDGATVEFALDDTVVRTSTFRSIAGADLVLSGPPGPRDLTIRFAGSAEHAPAELVQPVSVIGGGAPVPRVLEVSGEAGYPVRIAAVPNDPDLDAARMQVDLTDDGTFDVEVPVPATAFEQHTTYDHVYPEAFDGRLRVRITDRVGNVGESTAPVRIAPHRPLGALRMLRYQDRPVRGIALSRDGSRVLAQLTGKDAPAESPVPLVVLDRATGAGEVASVLPDGTQVSDYHGVLSDNGRFVAFASLPVQQSKVWVRDLQTRTTVLASTNAQGQPSTGRTQALGVSDDGATVLLVSESRDLVPTPMPDCPHNGSYACEHVYLKDLRTGAVTMLTKPEQNDNALTRSRADMTPDGRWVVFEADDAAHLHDTVAGTTEVLPIGTGHEYDLSDDGRLLVFHALDALTPGDDNETEDVHVLDRSTGQVRLVSAGRDGGATPGLSGFASLTACGALAAFMSSSADLVTGDTNGHDDVFLRDLRTGTTTRASIEARDGLEGDADSGNDPELSGDGRWLMFDADGTNLVPGDVEGLRDTFVLATGLHDACGSTPPPPPAGTAPVAQDLQVTTAAGQAVAVQLAATDAEDDALTYAVVTGPEHGTLTGTAPALTYTPSAGWSGTDTLVFTATDGRFTSAPATVRITVQPPPNADPVVVLEPREAGVEGGILPGTASVSDADGDAWAGTVDHGDGSGPKPLAVQDGRISLHHRYVQDGRYRVTVVVQDARGGTGRATAEVTVANARPEAVLTAPAPGTRVSVGKPFEVRGTFTDAGTADVHTAVVTVGGVRTQAVVEGGTVRATVVARETGTHALRLDVTDDGGSTGSADTVAGSPAYVVVHDPAAPVQATGGGSVAVPGGSVTFGFVVQGDAKGGWKGSFEMSTSSGRGLKGTAYDWATGAPGSVSFRGRGRLDGRDGAVFVVHAVDGSPDRVRVRVWDAAGVLVLDTQGGAPEQDAPQPVSTGSVTVHRRR